MSAQQVRFPFSSFPYRLEDKKERKLCYFTHRDDAMKYIKRTHLKKSQYILLQKCECLLDPDPR